MAAVALHWATKLAGARGSAAAALAAGVPRGALTFAHQLWGETCVYSAAESLRSVQGVCMPQWTAAPFDAVLSYEILFRVLTGYFREPYF
mmetsp:Transcript_23226/g.68532  ORF Transcript_23226/g.68532 Transcript_23226/m.68532 type:complete len:90 (-) Transcript_23226:49-318(-)